MTTRTQNTERAYRNSADQILLRYRNETNASSPESTDRLTYWLAALRDTVTPATWRQYRAALAWTFDQQRNPALAEAVRDINTSGCLSRTATPVKERRTSGRKQKTLPDKDRMALHTSLGQSRSRYANAVRLMLEAGRLTGLRPAEWQTACLERSSDGEVTLVARNAKATNDRAHGEFRTLHVGALSEAEINVIENMIRLAESTGEDWSSYYDNCRVLLTYHTKRLWPNRARLPTLYSARHQFAADAKAAGLSRSEVAALMGHGADRTAGEHYGRKRHGRGGFRVAPDPAEVQRVRETFKTRPAENQAQKKPAQARSKLKPIGP